MEYLKDNDMLKLDNDKMVESDYEQRRMKSGHRLSRDILNNKRTTNTTVNKNF